MSYHTEVATLWEVVTFWKVEHQMESFAELGACEEECPIKKTADLIQGRWTTLVIRELLPGKKRFSEIQRGLAGISPKVLTARLRHLESNGVLTRTAFPTVPPSTEYELTSLGQNLEAVLLAMAEFGDQLPGNAMLANASV